MTFPGFPGSVRTYQYFLGFHKSPDVVILHLPSLICFHSFNSVFFLGLKLHPVEVFIHAHVVGDNIFHTFPKMVLGWSKVIWSTLSHPRALLFFIICHNRNTQVVSYQFSAARLTRINADLLVIHA